MANMPIGELSLHKKIFYVFAARNNITAKRILRGTSLLDHQFETEGSNYAFINQDFFYFIAQSLFRFHERMLSEGIFHCIFRKYNIVFLKPCTSFITVKISSQNKNRWNSRQSLARLASRF